MRDGWVRIFRSVTRLDVPHRPLVSCRLDSRLGTLPGHTLPANWSLRRPPSRVHTSVHMAFCATLQMEGDDGDDIDPDPGFESEAGVSSGRSNRHDRRDSTCIRSELLHPQRPTEVRGPAVATHLRLCTARAQART